MISIYYVKKYCNRLILFIFEQVSAALMAVVMSILKMHQDHTQSFIANVLNHVALAFVTGTLFCDVIRMNFGLDPAVAINYTVIANHSTWKG